MDLENTAIFIIAMILWDILRTVGIVYLIEYLRSRKKSSSSDG